MNQYRGRGRRGGGAGHSRGGGGGRPPGLSGREIGMYYRNKSLKSKEEEKRTGAIRLNPSVDVPPSVLYQVHQCLETFEQQNQDERVCHEFQEHFNHLLNVSFEEFLKESKRKAVIAEQQEMNIDGREREDNFNSRLKLELERKRDECEDYRKKYKMRQRLPAMQQGQLILKAIGENQVVLVVGSTGCGKTTQIPQMILDEYIMDGRASKCHIVCTQPRRISAISVAERVAYERNESLGSSVGYQIRLER